MQNERKAPRAEYRSVFLPGRCVKTAAPSVVASRRFFRASKVSPQRQRSRIASGQKAHRHRRRGRPSSSRWSTPNDIPPLVALPYSRRVGGRKLRLSLTPSIASESRSRRTRRARLASWLCIRRLAAARNYRSSNEGLEV